MGRYRTILGTPKGRDTSLSKESVLPGKRAAAAALCDQGCNVRSVRYCESIKN